MEASHTSYEWQGWLSLKIPVPLSTSIKTDFISGSIFEGYYNDYESTQKAFEDGWFLTGDAGYFDDDGHLIIIGRKQDIIRDKEGNAFSPDFIETRLKFSLYVKEAVIFGEGRPFITALINIDMGNAGNWAEDRMIPYTTYTDLSQRPEVEQLILEEVEKVNTELPGPMKIKRFILLYKLLDADDEELTPNRQGEEAFRLWPLSAHDRGHVLGAQGASGKGQGPLP